MLIPILQALGVFTTLLHLRRWRTYPETRPSGRRSLLLHIGLPIIPDLLLASIAAVSFGGRRAGFVFLFAPDFSWTFLVAGGFAAIWTFLRTWLTVRTLRKKQIVSKLTFIPSLQQDARRSSASAAHLLTVLSMTNLVRAPSANNRYCDERRKRLDRSYGEEDLERNERDAAS